MEDQANKSPKDVEPKRRRRPPLSCITCRRRKLKCDRCAPCSQCIKSRTPDNCSYVIQPGVTPDEEPLEGEGPVAGDGPRATSMERNLHVFHARGDSRVAKTAGSSRTDELRELRGRVMMLESALAKSTMSSLSSPLMHTPESLDDGGGGGYKRPREEGVAPMVDVLPDPCFRGTNDKTRYVGRSNYALTMYLVSDLYSLAGIGHELIASFTTLARC